MPETARETARRRLAALFKQSGLDSPDLDARVLLCAACGIDHAGFVRDPHAPLGDAVDQLAQYARRRIEREPVSRILGTKEFWGLGFTVTSDVLDPRPETEGLVASLIDALGFRRDDPLDVLDLGTGSGAILCALLTELPAARGIGVDRSLAACRVARGNIEVLGLAERAHIVCASWSGPLRKRFDVVASNPPYIPRAEISTLAPEVRRFDPSEALDGGADGLDAYRDLVARLPAILRSSGIVAFECGAGQGEQVADLMRGAGLRGVMVYKDLAGHGRVVIGSNA